MSALWLVEIAEKDWDYDRFERAVVWAETAEQAEEIIRAAWWTPPPAKRPDLWIESPKWSLEVSPAPTEGVALVHWHAG